MERVHRVCNKVRTYLFAVHEFDGTAFTPVRLSGLPYIYSKQIHTILPRSPFSDTEIKNEKPWGRI